MNRKCADNELFENTNYSQHSVYNDAAFLSFDEPVDQIDFQKLGQWILQARDGEINQSDFQKLQHCLLTNPQALRYYVEFMWLCAELHEVYHEKQAVLV